MKTTFVSWTSKLLAALVLGVVAGAIGVFLVAQPVPPPEPVIINFNWRAALNTNAGPITYRIYFGNNLTNRQTLLHQTTGTNATILLTPQAGFFSMTASNFWGEGSFTKAVGVPAPIEPGDREEFVLQVRN